MKRGKTNRHVPGNALGKVTANEEFIPSKVFQQLCFKYNTVLPLSATGERMFPVGKDVLKPKRSRLSDEHFGTLFFRNIENYSIYFF